jgi:hypothetical protein
MEEVRKYLKDNLSISIEERWFGFNGKRIVIELKLEGEVISDDSYTTKPDDE